MTLREMVLSIDFEEWVEKNYVLFRVNDVPVESLLDVECEESDFDLVMWELARSGRKWKY